MQLNDMILVSVDDHVIEPATMFDQHLSREHRKLAPEYVTDDQGNSIWWWEHEQKKTYNVGLNAVVGRPKEEYGFEPTAIDQMRRGTWDVHARIADMNVNGLLGSLNFGTFVNFDGSYFFTAQDKANALRVLRAYNDWHIDEWCAAYPGRFIPLAILPCWDPAACVEEVKRVVKKGCHAVSFPENPTTKGLPSIHNEVWEPLWKVCHDLRVVINCHIGTGNPPPHPSEESPISAWITAMPISIALGAADWLHLTALNRYSHLKIALSEGGIGWIPYFLERADFTYHQHGAWTRSTFGKRLPSEVFREHFITCFIDDRAGCKNLTDIGEDIVCYECDYPHSDCVWPLAPDVLMKNFTGLSDTTIDKITHLNAMREFQYDPFSILRRENCTVGALRAQARDVDTQPRSSKGEDPRVYGDPNKPVSSGDVWRIYRDSKA